MFDLHLAKVADFVRTKGAHRVALQFPEGLKPQAVEAADEIERITGCICIILGDPCYGACDLNTSYRSFADVLVHFGHSEIPSMITDNNVLFVEVKLDYDITDLLQATLDRSSSRVGLVTTVQHVHQLPMLKEWLERHGRTVLIGQGDKRVKNPGQVLGCNVSAASSIKDKVDQFLYLGSGDFHPLAVSLATGKPVIVLDPMMQEVRDVEQLKERILRQRHGAISLASEAKSFGIIISSKPGQQRKALADKLKEMILSKGKRASLIMMDNVTPEQLLAFQLEAFVSTACPRLAIDDYLRYRKPMLTPIELEVALGSRSWDDYIFDSFLG
jgi:2-(3-amino-3-carboxypropyl)histidine synthase